MKPTTVRVPLSLVLDPALKASTKVIWMVVRLNKPGLPAEVGLVQGQSGLSRPTIRKGLGELEGAGWYSPTAGGLARDLTPTVEFPRDLLVDRRVGPSAKLIYAILQTMSTGQFTYANLSIQANANLKTTRGSVKELVDSNWVRVAQANQVAPIRFSLHNPVAEQAEAEVIRANHRLLEAGFKGEEIMREFLSLLVASDEFQDDASPAFLENPLTDERMQYDRFYAAGVAFEFNGPQHDGPTKRYSKLSVFRRQRARDLMKFALSAHKQVELVIVHVEDLSLKRMKSLVGDLLPLRDLAGYGPLVDFLEKTAWRHRMAAKRQQLQESTKPSPNANPKQD